MGDKRCIIVSDGSASADARNAASACIVQYNDALDDGTLDQVSTSGSSLQQYTRIKLVMYLGSGDSTDSEILAGILGLAYLYALAASADPIKDVTWVADNKTVLSDAELRVRQWQANSWRTSKGAMVRKRSLWQAYLFFKGSSELRPVYYTEINGQQRRHQACDKASRWVEQKALVLLESDGEGAIGRLGQAEPEKAWQLIDGREFVGQLREGRDIEAACEKFLQHLKNLLKI